MSWMNSQFTQSSVCSLEYIHIDIALSVCVIGAPCNRTQMLLRKRKEEGKNFFLSLSLSPCANGVIQLREFDWRQVRGEKGKQDTHGCVERKRVRSSTLLESKWLSICVQIQAIDSSVNSFKCFWMCFNWPSTHRSLYDNSYNNRAGERRYWTRRYRDDTPRPLVNAKYTHSRSGKRHYTLFLSPSHTHRFIVTVLSLLTYGHGETLVSPVLWLFSSRPVTGERSLLLSKRLSLSLYLSLSPSLSFFYSFCLDHERPLTRWVSESTRWIRSLHPFVPLPPLKWKQWHGELVPGLLIREVIHITKQRKDTSIKMIAGLTDG